MLDPDKDLERLRNFELHAFLEEAYVLCSDQSFRLLLFCCFQPFATDLTEMKQSQSKVNSCHRQAQE